MAENITNVPYMDAVGFIDKVEQQGEVKGMNFKFEMAKLDSKIPNDFVEYSKAIENIVSVEGIKKQPGAMSFKDTTLFSQMQASARQQNQSDLNSANAIEIEKKQKMIQVGDSSMQRMHGTLRAAGADIARIVVELEKDAGRLESTVEDKVSRMGKGNMVMDKMSLQDQISDLEKIYLGVEQGAFSEIQLAVIKSEVKNLHMIAKRQNIDNLDDAQKSIVILRNQRLEDVLNKLALNN